MFVGHGLLAFALVALLGERRGWDRSTLLPVAVLAGLFGALPDVDVVYGLAGLVSGPVGPEAFWTAGNRVHRGVTHAPPVAVVTALAAGAVAAGARGRFESRDAFALDRTFATAAGVAALAGVVAVAAAVSGPLAAAVATFFAGGVVALAAVARRYGLSSRAVAGAALVGLGTHPFGDLFTGSPPALLYPLDAVVVAGRVTPAADPTLHLLAAFGLELAVAWLAVVAYCRATGQDLRSLVDRRAALGAVYGPAALVLPAPTLAVSYHFVFSVLAVGVVGVAPSVSLPRPRPRPRLARSAATALATVSAAALAYTAVYLLA